MLAYVPWLLGVLVLLRYGIRAQRAQKIPLYVRPAHWRDWLVLGWRIAMFLLGLWLLSRPFSATYQNWTESSKIDGVFFHLITMGLPLVLGFQCLRVAIPGLDLLALQWSASFQRTPLPWVLAILLCFSVYMHCRTIGWFAELCPIAQSYIKNDVARERDLLEKMALARGHDALDELLNGNTQKSIRYRYLRGLERTYEKICRDSGV